MSRFAEKTTVSSAKSRAEIEDTLARYGATGFLVGTTTDRALIAFEAKGRRIKFILPLPNREQFRRTPTRGIVRSPEDAAAAYEQGIRQSWRALSLCIKAKLESVEAGIETFEEAFLAHIVLPSGETMSEHALPRIEEAYRSGRMPPLLPGPNA